MLFLQEDGRKRKLVIKIEFTPLPDLEIVPFLKGFLKNQHPLTQRLSS